MTAAPQAMSFTERVRTLKKLRQALEEQRDAFHSYLLILEEQEVAILRSDSEELEHSVELERTILHNIIRVQRVIDPLATLYQKAGAKEAHEVEGLQESLTRLKGQVLKQNQENRRLLTEHIQELRTEVQRLRVPNAQAILSSMEKPPGSARIDLTA